MKSPWRLLICGCLTILAGSLLAYLVQTSGDITI
jgi:hypothetical protein